MFRRVEATPGAAAGASDDEFAGLLPDQPSSGEELIGAAPRAPRWRTAALVSALGLLLCGSLALVARSSSRAQADASLAMLQLSDVGCGGGTCVLKSQGQPSVCRAGAHDRSVDGLGTAIVARLTLQTCKAICLRLGSCTGVEFRASESRCELHQHSIVALSQTFVVPADFECFTKGRAGPADATEGEILEGLGHIGTFTSHGKPTVCRAGHADRSYDGLGAIVLTLPLAECKTLCRGMTSCTGVEFRASESRCELHRHPIVASTQELFRPNDFECLTKVAEDNGQEEDILGSFDLAVDDPDAFVGSPLAQAGLVAGLSKATGVPSSDISVRLTVAAPQSASLRGLSQTVHVSYTLHLFLDLSNGTVTPSAVMVALATPSILVEAVRCGLASTMPSPPSVSVAALSPPREEKALSPQATTSGAAGTTGTGAGEAVVGEAATTASVEAAGQGPTTTAAGDSATMVQSGGQAATTAPGITVGASGDGETTTAGATSASGSSATTSLETAGQGGRTAAPGAATTSAPGPVAPSGDTTASHVTTTEAESGTEREVASDGGKSVVTDAATPSRPSPTPEPNALQRSAGQRRAGRYDKALAHLVFACTCAWLW